MKTIFRASLETRHFRFEAFGANFAECESAMMATIEVHCGVYRVSAERFLEEYQTSITYAELVIGGGYRDGELITEP